MEMYDMIEHVYICIGASVYFQFLFTIWQKYEKIEIKCIRKKCANLQKTLEKQLIWEYNRKRINVEKCAFILPNVGKYYTRHCENALIYAKHRAA